MLVTVFPLMRGHGSACTGLFLPVHLHSIDVRKLNTLTELILRLRSYTDNCAYIYILVDLLKIPLSKRPGELT